MDDEQTAWKSGALPLSSPRVTLRLHEVGGQVGTLVFAYQCFR